MKAIETVGILGLGKMGCPIAAHLVAKGFKVVGYDPLEEARKKAVALGARSAASARELARSSDLVIVLVGFDSEVEEVIFGKDGVLEGAKPGLVVARASKRLRRRASSLSTAQETPTRSSSADPFSARSPRTFSIWGRQAQDRSRRWSTTLSSG